jgi:gentisate 1,2-dioxygenase
MPTTQPTSPPTFSPSTICFSINDLPVLESFDLNREEALDEGDGHQKVQHSA